MHIYERMGDIRRKLHFDGPLFEVPPRPKHMRRLTYIRYLGKLYKLWQSPEMPIARFAKTIMDLETLESKLPIDLGSVDLALTFPSAGWDAS